MNIGTIWGLILGLLSEPVDIDGVTTFANITGPVPQKTLSLAAPPGYTPGSNVGQISVASTPTSYNRRSRQKHCIVIPHGWGQDDAAQIQAAVDTCGVNGIITLPAPYVYTIKSRLYTRLVRSRLNVHGTLSFAADLGYWIHESHRIEFQNQSTAWIAEGHDFIIDGGGWQQGGIHGNGQAWYTFAQGHSNAFGRPIALTIFNSSNVTVQDFSVRDPQFWTFYIQDSHDVALRGIYINGTSTDPNGNSSNYETNVDGFDTIRVNNLLIEDWAFHGGDDCAAPKGNSTNLILRNMTCVGGGIAFGSVGQYPGAPDYIQNVSVSDVSVASLIRPGYGGANVSGGAYFKSWVGVEAGTPPQGGGGGTGRVSHVSFTNLRVENTTQAVFINKCYFKVASQGNFCDTSTLEFQGFQFKNVTGTVASTAGITLNCSEAAPCRDIKFEDVDLVAVVSKGNKSAGVKCDNTMNVTGIDCP